MGLKGNSHAFEAQGRTEELARLSALQSLEGMRTFWDFDGRVTAPLHGFASAAEYYRRCSSAYFIGSIARPTLVIHSSDDPFVYPHSVPPSGEWASCVTLELHAKGAMWDLSKARHGGHAIISNTACHTGSLHK